MGGVDGRSGQEARGVAVVERRRPQSVASVRHAPLALMLGGGKPPTLVAIDPVQRWAIHMYRNEAPGLRVLGRSEAVFCPNRHQPSRWLLQQGRIRTLVVGDTCGVCRPRSASDLGFACWSKEHMGRTSQTSPGDTTDHHPSDIDVCLGAGGRQLSLLEATRCLDHPGFHTSPPSLDNPPSSRFTDRSGWRGGGGVCTAGDGEQLETSAARPLGRSGGTFLGHRVGPTRCRGTSSSMARSPSSRTPGRARRGSSCRSSTWSARILPWSATKAAASTRIVRSSQSSPVFGASGFETPSTGLGTTGSLRSTIVASRRSSTKGA